MYFCRDALEESRGNLGSGYFKNSEPVMWNFKSSIVFDRLNKYIDRLEKVQVWKMTYCIDNFFFGMAVENAWTRRSCQYIASFSFLQTVFDAGVEYSKLEKVEIGGLKGRILGQKVEKLFEEFKTIFSGFTRIEYDPLNPDDRSFERDEMAFKENMKDLEGRLAAIITQAFDDCCNFESLSKVRSSGSSQGGSHAAILERVAHSSVNSTAHDRRFTRIPLEPTIVERGLTLVIP